MLPDKLQKKLDARGANNSLRELPSPSSAIDFSSNDYLGFSKNPAFAKAISERAQSLTAEHNCHANGATGSRLLSGNHKLYGVAETMVSRFHESESALIFNSGYDANIGFFQCVPQRGDVIIYDEYIHASIRDGIAMSNAKAYKFKHNNQEHLEQLLIKHHAQSEQELYVITESVFSMDGDAPDLIAILEICKKYGVHLIIDEAHATGVMGDKGQGLVQQLGIAREVFARIVTFGKGIGAHGAAILGSNELRHYLVNYARSFIYTTGLPPHSVATVIAAYEQLIGNKAKQDVASKNVVASRTKQPLPFQKLQSLISHFNSQLKTFNLDSKFIHSQSAIHCAVITGNEKVKTLSRKLAEHNFEVKPILSPTVPKNQERLRICLHAFNTEKEITELLAIIKQHI